MPPPGEYSPPPFFPPGAFGVRGRGGPFRAVPRPPRAVPLPRPRSPGAATDASEPLRPLQPREYRLAVKHLEQRYNQDQYFCISEPVDGGPPARDADDRWREWALCIIRNFDHKHRLVGTDLAIKSPLMRRFLARVIGHRYPGVSFATDTVLLDFPLKSLFHFLPELRKAAADLSAPQPTPPPSEPPSEPSEPSDPQSVTLSDGPPSTAPSDPSDPPSAEAGSGSGSASGAEAISGTDSNEERRLELEHVAFFMDWLETELAPTVREVTDLMSQGLITYSLLWALFKPGDLLYAPADGDHHSRVVRHYEGAYTDNGGGCPQLRLVNEYVSYDGQHFGLARACAAITPFAGTRRIRRLPVFPLARHANAAAVRARLEARGRRFEELRGAHYGHYAGVALGDYDETTRRLRRFAVHGPIMVDCAGFARMQPDLCVPTANPCF